MILDKNLLFATAQAITASAASTDVIDLGVLADVGIGEELEVLALVTEAFTASGSGTLTVALQGSVDNSTFTDMAVSRAIGKADLVAGAEAVRWKIPGVAAGQAMPRYLRMYYTVATGPMTAGKITAGIILDRQAAHAYAPGIAISN